jgi:hypothetical protein
MIKRIRWSTQHVLEQEFATRADAAAFVAEQGGLLESVTEDDGFSHEAIGHCEACNLPIFDDDTDDSYAYCTEDALLMHTACIPDGEDEDAESEDPS